MTLREAGSADAEALTACEHAAYGTGLGHVFGDIPWPEEAIRQRWLDELVEPGVTTLVADGEDDQLAGFATYDGEMLRHLGVVPAQWGSGLAASLHDEVLRRYGDRPIRLWVLEANARARAFYARRGWVLDGRRSVAQWPPYPVQVGMSRHGAAASG